MFTRRERAQALVGALGASGRLVDEGWHARVIVPPSVLVSLPPCDLLNWQPACGHWVIQMPVNTNTRFTN